MQVAMDHLVFRPRWLQMTSNAKPVLLRGCGATASLGEPRQIEHGYEYDVTSKPMRLNMWLKYERVGEGEIFATVLGELCDEEPQGMERYDV